MQKRPQGYFITYIGPGGSNSFGFYYRINQLEELSSAGKIVIEKTNPFMKPLLDQEGKQILETIHYTMTSLVNEIKI